MDNKQLSLLRPLAESESEWTLPKEIEATTKEMVASLKSEGTYISGKRPNGIVATCVWLASVEEGYDYPSQVVCAEVFGTTQPTIQRHWRDVLKICRDDGSIKNTERMISQKAKLRSGGLEPLSERNYEYKYKDELDMG